MSRRVICCTSFAVALLALLADRLVAAPVITNVSLRGLQAGGTTTLVIDGRDLAPNPQLLLDAPSTDIRIKDGSSDKRIEAEVTVAKGVSPGIYALRVCSGKGVSSPILLGVDALVQSPMTDTIEKLPVALHGRVTGPQILTSTFQGKKGQRVLLDVEAKRLGSPLEPVVRLYDAHGAQVAWSPPLGVIGGDARCQIVLPSDGRYTIELHDRLYRGKAPGYFRLKVGDLHFADILFPLAAAPAKPTSLSFVSSSLGDDAALKITPPSEGGFAPVDVARFAGFTGARPTLIVSQATELLETSASDGGPQELPSAPVAVSGRISTKGQQDVYHLKVREGAKLRIDVLADRAGSPLDGVLSVKRAAGQQLAQSDDRPGTSDPGVEVTVPKGETRLAIALSDLRGDGGPEFVYRLLVEEGDAAKPTVTTSEAAVNVPAGGSQVLQVEVKRNGAKGPIRLQFSGLPEGVTAHDAEIAAGDSLGLIALTADDSASNCGVARITAIAKEGQRSIEVPVLLEDFDAARRQPWLREQIAVAAAPAVPIRLAWSGDADQDVLLLGGSTPLSVTIDRTNDAQGKVRLRLVTTQTPPQKTVKQGRRDVMVEDEGKTLRLEKAVELAPDADQAEVRLAAPNDLPQRPWSVALIGELLAPDGKTVLASAATPVRRLNAKRAVELALASEAKIKAIAGDGGETGVLKGTLLRKEGVTGPATLTLVGLPAGYPAPKLEVPADKSDFEFAIRFPAAAKPGQLKDVRLLATTLAKPDDENSTVTSNELPITLTVVKP
ncbi:MAG: hypothetical protein RIC55_11600 [Pirellulaceae bacterium]